MAFETFPCDREFGGMVEEVVASKESISAELEYCGPGRLRTRSAPAFAPSAATAGKLAVDYRRGFFAMAVPP